VSRSARRSDRVNNDAYLLVARSVKAESISNQADFAVRFGDRLMVVVELDERCQKTPVERRCDDDHRPTVPVIE
jgi:hypothetical protein